MRSLITALLIALPVIGWSQESGENDHNHWGNPVDPDGDCEFIFKGKLLTVIVPGTPHDLSAELNRMNAPRVLKTVEGDFVAEVSIDGKFSPGDANISGRTAYHGAGFVLMQDDKNYIRLERAVLTRGGQESHYANFELRVNGQIVRFGAPSDFSFDPLKTSSLRIERKGDEIRGAVRQGDADWHYLPSKKISFSKTLQIGLAALNASDSVFQPSYSDYSTTSGTTKPSTLDSGNSKSSSSQEGKLKAVLFGENESANTKKLIELADNGWHYLGPLGKGMVAFHYLP